MNKQERLKQFRIEDLKVKKLFDKLDSQKRKIGVKLIKQ